MYTHCHLCHHDLGENASIPTMPVGRQLAYDPGRGRLWIVCPRCSEWNLTPIEERWEAIQTCEALFASSAVRVSSANVGLARVQDLELVRVGDAVRDELANWRYGPRFTRRRRRAAVMITGAGALAGGALGGALLAGIVTSQLGFAAWAGVTGSVLLWDWARTIGRRIGPYRNLRIVVPGGQVVRLPSASLGHVRLLRERAGKAIGCVRVPVPRQNAEIELRDEDALVLLGELLPRLNWRGLTTRELGRATAIVDRAEEWARDREERGKPFIPAWQRIAAAQWPRRGAIAVMGPISRAALEMAVTEELERRAMAGDAALLASHWLNAEEIASIADDMFLPEWITRWIDRHRRSTHRQRSATDSR